METCEALRVGGAVGLCGPVLAMVDARERPYGAGGLGGGCVLLLSSGLCESSGAECAIARDVVSRRNGGVSVQVLMPVSASSWR